ncbi:MAG: hydroxymethylpyrimidine/phosphomethylpyrimidine kinase [Clostridiales bacterium]|nr:hydroxymethylpyrimidine/phosphomethylpyrimidine kinase [Clostridiales bacterium]
MFDSSELKNNGNLKKSNGAYASDCLAKNRSVKWFSSERINSRNTHGTGCTLSSAIACGLALGHTLENSVAAAKKYLAAALGSGLNLGKGNGPLNHMFGIKPPNMPNIR